MLLVAIEVGGGESDDVLRGVGYERVSAAEPFGRSEEHPNGRRPNIGIQHGQIQDAISVEISRDHTAAHRSTPGERLACSEIALPIVVQDLHVRADQTRNIQVAVLTEVAYGVGNKTFGRQAGWGEGAGPVVHEERVACNQIDRTTIVCETTSHNRARVIDRINCGGLESTVAVP